MSNIENTTNTDIIEILKEINESNSTNYKLSVLKKYKDNTELAKILKYTYDCVSYVYGVSKKSILNFPSNDSETDRFTYPRMFDLLEKLADRTFTGHKALSVCRDFIDHTLPERADLFLKIISHDLRLNISTKTINKVWKDLIQKPHYCRCDVFGTKSSKNIHFPAIIQLKCDGTYREALVADGKVTFRTRSGEPSFNPVLEKEMANLENGVYTGEWTIGNADDPSANRSEGNGLINSDNPPYEDIIFTVWDKLTVDEYNCSGESRIYGERLNHLKDILNNSDVNHIKVVPSYEVNDIKSALEKVSQWMSNDLEGGVLKDINMLFKNGTSKQQLKIKLKVDAEMRITGFSNGTGKRQGKVGAIIFENDEKTIRGKCSGFSDKEMGDFTQNKELYIGKIISVEFNDLIKAEGHEYYALSHPRFIEIRKDKDETDSLEKVKKLCEMAKNLC